MFMHTTNPLNKALVRSLFLLLAMALLVSAGFMSKTGIMLRTPKPSAIEQSVAEPKMTVIDYEEALSHEYEWLNALVRHDGAMTIGGDNTRIIPYFSNIAAIELVKHDPNSVRNYMDWYLRHLNQPDRWGLEGTIYDYEIINEECTSTKRYDSADSYAATFLSLIYSYVDFTKDTDFIESNRISIDSICQVIIQLQDPRDGLVWSKADRLIKFLMDNTETYKGLLDWSNTLKILGETEEADFYYSKALDIKRGIESSLWDEDSGTYIWAIYPLGIKRRVNWNKWYPDAVSQLYPILNNLISVDDWKARSIYASFNSHFSEWPINEKRDPFPWVSVAFVAKSLGDNENVHRFLEMAKEQYLSDNRPYPWYSLESAYLIKTLQIGNQNEITLADP